MQTCAQLTLAFFICRIIYEVKFRLCFISIDAAVPCAKFVDSDSFKDFVKRASVQINF